MDLVVMAAGMGSRFGGLKQIEPVDEDKNFIIDYSIYDAIKAGFDRVIFIIKEENYEIFRSTIGDRLGQKIAVEYVFQRLDDIPNGVQIPEGRVKPWGTAHAIYAVRNVVSDRFAIINADDFYGYESYEIIANALSVNTDNEFIAPGYLVKNTLSEKGAVKRGVFIENNGNVSGLIESQIEKRGDEYWATPLNEDNWYKISGDALVSMNMFGFTGELIKRLDKDSVDFFANSDLNKAEFLIPSVVNDMIEDGNIVLRLEKTPAKWYGITYKEDLQTLKDAIQEMVKDGKYPKHLYEKENQSIE